MKKQIYLITLISLFLLLPKLSYADCKEEVIERFSEIENHYVITYELDKENMNYNLTLKKDESNDYVYIIQPDNFECKKETETTDICSNVQPGTYTVKIMSFNNNCNVIVKETTIDLPEHNKYYDDPLCNGIEEFILCQPTYDKSISYEDFVSRINTYKNSKAKKEKQEIANKNDNKINEYIAKNYQILSISIAGFIAIVLIIILIVKKIKKSGRLE